MSFLLVVPLLLIIFVSAVVSNTECVWVIGRLICHQNQTRVIGSIVALFDLDGPETFGKTIYNVIDADDKIGLTVVDNKDGYFNVDGCGNDQDWIQGIKNRPEMYIQVFHYCKSAKGSITTVKPPFRVFAPHTYDYHIRHPISLD